MAKEDTGYNLTEGEIDYITGLTDKEIEKIERVQGAFSRRAESEAAWEGQLKWRVLFERTAVEELPFVIYCIYVPIVAVIAFSKIDLVAGSKLSLGIYLLSIVIIMVIPLLILPKILRGINSIINKFKFLKKDSTSKKNGNLE